MGTVTDAGEGAVQWTDDDWEVFYYAREGGLEDWMVLAPMLFKGPMTGEQVLAMVESLNNSPGQILDEVHSVPLDERQAILQRVIDNPASLERFGDPGFATVYVAALHEGALYWSRGSGPDPHADYWIYIGTDLDPTDDPYWKDNHNAFAKWIRDDWSTEEEARANMPDPFDQKTSMNCWEFALHSRYIAGEMTYQELRDWHKDAADAAKRTGDINDYYSVLEGKLGADSANSLPEPLAPGVQGPQFVPPPGSLIFFNDLDHVVVATGRLVGGEIEVMSLWVYPVDSNTGDYVHTAQRTTVEELMRAGGYDWNQMTWSGR